MLEDKNTATTPLEEVGEFGLIHRIKKNISFRSPSTVKGIGDDAAVADFGNQLVLTTTDMLNEGVHFDLGYSPLKHVGYKAIVTNLSDLYAMNALPKQVFVSIGISNRFPVEAIEELFAGIHLACKIYEVELAGGDTTSSQSGLIIGVTAIGSCKKEEVIYRSNVKNTDLLVVSGDLGAAYFGLQVLRRENEVWKVNPNVQPDLAQYNYIIERQLKPEARKDIIKLLKDLDVHPTAMIDVSDGLASEILHLSEESNCGFKVYEDKIPLDPQVITTAEEFGINPITAALNGGEDYELLFTIPIAELNKIKGNPSLSVIGHATDKASGCQLVHKGSNTVSDLTSQGWDAFLKEKYHTNNDSK